MSDDKRQVTGFKLKPEVRAKLEEMAAISDRTMTAVITAAINALYDAHAGPPVRRGTRRQGHGAPAAARGPARRGVLEARG